MTVKVNFLAEPAIIPYKDFTYATNSDGIVLINDEALIIPKGYETDLASIPRVLWPVFPPQETKYVAPSILHDYLYSIQYKNDRKLDDDVFFEALIAKGVSKIIAFTFWAGVRIFGGSHYGSAK